MLEPKGNYKLDSLIFQLFPKFRPDMGGVYILCNPEDAERIAADMNAANADGAGITADIIDFSVIRRGGLVLVPYNEEYAGNVPDGHAQASIGRHGYHVLAEIE